MNATIRPEYPATIQCVGLAEEQLGSFDRLPLPDKMPKLDEETFKVEWGRIRRTTRDMIEAVSSPDFIRLKEYVVSRMGREKAEGLMSDFFINL